MYFMVLRFIEKNHLNNRSPGISSSLVFRYQKRANFFFKIIIVDVKLSTKNFH